MEHDSRCGGGGVKAKERVHGRICKGGSEVNDATVLLFRSTVSSMELEFVNSKEDQMERKMVPDERTYCWLEL